MAVLLSLAPLSATVHARANMVGTCGYLHCQEVR